MRLAAVSTVVREAEVGRPSGYLRLVDLEAERVVFRAHTWGGMHARADPNPRGGTRGVKGISVGADLLAVATVDRVVAYDDSWRLLWARSHPWFGGVHGLLVEDDCIWVTATSCDMLLKLSRSGDLIDAWSWRSDHSLREQLGFGGVPDFDPSRDYRDPLATGGAFDLVHLNSVARGRTGLLLNFGQVCSKRSMRRHRHEKVLIRLLEQIPAARPLLRSVRRRRLRRPPDHDADGKPLPQNSFALVELSEGADGGAASTAAGGRARIIHRRNRVGFPNHDVIEIDGRIYFNDTNTNEVVVLDRGGAEVLRVPVPSAHGFARGLARLDGDLFLAGNQDPAALHVIDIAAGRAVSSIPLAGELQESVCHICILPSSFGTVPDELAGFDVSETQAA